MISFAIEPEECHLFFKERFEQIRNAIFLFYDFVNDREGKLEEREKRCLIFDYNESRVLLLFPLINNLDLSEFHTICYSNNFKFTYLGLIGDEESHLTPSATYPLVSLTSSIYDFLGLDNDTMIQDITIKNIISMDLKLVINSKNCPRIGDIYTLWEKDRTHTRLEIGSILKRVSEEEYSALIYNNALKKLEQLKNYEKISQSCENIISGLIYEWIVDIVVYCNKSWWIFNDGMWKQGGESYIWNILSEQFNEFLDGEGYKYPSLTIELKTYMGSVTSRSRILKDLSLKLTDVSFVDKLNSIDGIIRVTNGTYDFEKRSLRESLPYDYFSISCGSRYLDPIPREEMYELVEILNQIFPRKEVLKFFIRSCSSFLERYNKNKVFYVWWGKGNNSKSLLQKFVSSVLGDYAITLSSSLITGKKANSSEATPDIQYSQNRLVVFLQEPNTDDKIQVGRIKELTGNDRIYTRDLYKSAGSMEFKAKIVLVVNNAMESSNMDNAFRRRVVVIPFESTFTENPKGEFQFPIDKDIETKIFKYKEAFLNILIHEFDKFREEEFLIPDYIKDTTLNYITLNNFCLRYIKCRLYRKEGSNILISEIYEDFKEWFRNSYPGRRIPNVQTFNNEMKNEDYDDYDNEFTHVDFIHD
jgi:P4 family phage/plasmid primase-like protien